MSPVGKGLMSYLTQLSREQLRLFLKLWLAVGTCKFTALGRTKLAVLKLCESGCVKNLGQLGTKAQMGQGLKM